ncbi:MAG: hypothetical protein K8U03_11910 [Planctomycetia bacterium]|nr:hypothetical protein [Planctomycetia bacterium]
MNAAGWVIMIVSVTTVFVGCAYCVYRVLALPPLDAEAHLHAPLEIDSGKQSARD